MAAAKQDDPVATLAELLKQVLPLAERLASDLSRPEDRSRLHELAGQETVFDLTRLFTALCGERARSMGLQKGLAFIPEGRLRRK